MQGSTGANSSFQLGFTPLYPSRLGLDPATFSEETCRNPQALKLALVIPHSINPVERGTRMSLLQGTKLTSPQQDQPLLYGRLGPPKTKDFKETGRGKWQVNKLSLGTENGSYSQTQRGDSYVPIYFSKSWAWT